MQGVNQRIDGGGSVLLAELGKMDIAGGGSGASVPQQCLNLAQTQAAFQQVGSKAVTQGMYRGFFLIPHWCSNAFIAVWALLPPMGAGRVSMAQTYIVTLRTAK